MRSFIIPAAKSDGALPANPEGVKRLEARIREVAQAAVQERKPVAPLPPTAARVSGQWYVAEPNMFGLVGCSLTFAAEEEALLSVGLCPPAVEEDVKMDWAVGLDNVYRVSAGRFGLPVAVRGWWESENVFIVDLDEVGNINHWRMSMTFEGDVVRAVMWEASGLPLQVIEGRAE